LTRHIRKLNFIKKKSILHNLELNYKQEEIVFQENELGKKLIIIGRNHFVKNNKN